MMKRTLFFLLPILLLISCGVKNAKKEGKPSVYATNFEKARVVLLGTGTPNAEPERSGPCVAVVVKDSAYIVDIGPGVVRRAAAAYNKGVKALKTTNLKIAFCTHLHSDHTAGYPDLIFTPWVEGRDVPLEMYGPPGIRDMTEHKI